MGIDRDGYTDILNLKCDPLFSHTLFENFSGIIPAYHMNKNLWITVILEKDTPNDEIKNLINMSYALTLSKKEMKKYMGTDK